MALEERPALTPQQEKFALLVAGGTMSQADAYRAAYPTTKTWKPESVHVKASELAANVKVAARIRQLQEAYAAKVGLKAVDVLEEVRKLAHSDIASVMNPDGTVKLPNELDPATRAAIKKFEIDELGRIKYEFYDKNAALDKAMRHLGLYEKDNSQRDRGLGVLRDLLMGAVVRPRPEAAQPGDDFDDDDVIDMPT